MGLAAHRHAYTFAEYLDLEGSSNVKHEFLEGAIYAMAGGTPRHAALTLAVAASLFNGLRGGSCRAFSSDLRIRVLASGFAGYPDVTVVCGALEHDPASESTVTNPKLLVEVLSTSTQAFDLGEKFEHYKRIPTLQSVVYVWQDEIRVELRTRGSDGSWQSRTFQTGETIPLADIGCHLSVDEIYRDAAPPAG